MKATTKLLLFLILILIVIFIVVFNFAVLFYQPQPSVNADLEGFLDEADEALQDDLSGQEEADLGDSETSEEEPEDTSDVVQDPYIDEHFDDMYESFEDYLE